jgi:hypothetical protein
MGIIGRPADGLQGTLNTYAQSQSIGIRAQEAGYSVIKCQSVQGAGTNYLIFKDFGRILEPFAVAPVP